MLQQRNHGGNKRSSGTSRLSNSNLFPLSVDLGPFGAGWSTKSGSDSADAPGADPGYVMQLINDVRKLADVLLHLKEAFRTEENQDCLHQVVHERLEELLRVLKAVICKHPALNSVDILSTAGTVIAKVKGVNFEEVNEENKRNLFREIHSSIDTFAFTFGNVVSDFLMGDVDRGSVLGLSQTQSRSFENLTVETGKSVPEKDDLPGRPRAEDTDGPLRDSDSGVETALLYAKAWSKYTKDVLAWVEKRLSLDIECAKSIAKMAESAKTVANQQEYMPFREIYISAFKNDIEYSQLLLQSASALQSNKFIQPLLARKNDLDKRRKEIKDQWQREQKKMQEANSALKKAKLLRAQRREEYERAHFTTSRVEEEQLGGGGKQLEKRKRLEEEALQKAEEANDLYKACIADVGVKRVDLANAKSETLTQIRELVFQCDLTLKAVTVNWFQMQQALVVSLPVNHQSLCESAKLYEPGQRYADFIRSLPKDRQRGESFSFDVSGPQNAGLPLTSRLTSSTHSLHGNPSLAVGDFKDPDEPGSPLYARGTKIGERRSHSSIDIQALRTQGPFRAWSTGSQGGGMCSDSESAGGSSESRSMDSPTTSPGTGDFKRRLPRTPSTGTMSSADDLDEREPPSPSDIGLGEMTNETTSSPGPFRNAQMSKAAHTHKLRKLRAPSKCRECDGLVVFQGAECEECYLACHKKCLETLAIQCGHKKLQGRLHLFGIDFTQAAKNNPDGIPFIIKKCTSEIENRALNIKGIYRVNGAKSRVEKLCQAFENGKDLVELSDLSPHDISNVLKLYLRQLPEPLILFRYYNDFIGLAKESQNAIADDVDTARRGLTGEQSQISIELNRVLFKIKDLLRQLPPTHYRTLQFLIRHLYRVTEKADENKMTASNLGIIFGPTLIKPRQTDADVSLSSLVDYPYQALIVELLIRYYKKIFDIPLSPLPTLVLAEEKASLLLSVESRQNSQEKEQQLSRHSKSLIDIKEESSKVYTRHSSVFPSNRLLDEINEVKPNLDRKEFQTAPDSGPEEVNGLPPLGLQEKSSLVLSKSYQSTTKIQLRPLRSKMASRPISVPLDRLHKSDQVNERNSKDAIERGHSPAIQEVTEPDIPSSRVSLYSQKFYIDTQPLRKTPRTTMMTNVPPHSGTTDSGALSVSVPSLYTMGNNSTNTIFPNKPYTVAVKAAGSLKRDVNASECEPKTITLRAPRTLQPPPETFYKPPLPGKTKQSAEVGTKTSAVPSNSTEERALGVDKPVDGPSLDLEAHSHVSLLQLKTCSSSLEDFSQSEAKPVYQRLRPRRLQEFEHREAHFV